MGLDFSSIIANLPRPPTKAERQLHKAQSPITICISVSPKQYFCFFVGFFAWVVDAFDFFAVSVTLTRLETQFNRSIEQISTAITLTLLLRSLGAFAFGIITDRYGRRWPLTINLVLIAVLALATAFVSSFTQFLAVRALFGIMMGGVYGMATATALENIPIEARGLFSGLLQQGYAVGYLLAAVANLSLVSNTDDWRSIFYLGSGMAFFVAILRFFLPESQAFLTAQAEARRNPDPMTRSASKIYWDSLKQVLTLHWRLFLFCVFLMAGFNFFSHGSQDLYPTFVQISKGMTRKQASLLTIIGNFGSILGGALAGWMSQFIGRRLTIIMMVLWAAAFIPLWILPSGFVGLAFGAFFLQFGVQGSWGVVPIYLSEVSPPAFRAIFTGLSYQLGNMISAASTQIEARAGESRRIIVAGRVVQDYALVQGLFIGAVAVYMVVMTSLGREYRGRSFDETAIHTDKTRLDQEIPDIKIVIEKSELASPT